ncbi:hypothetical protein ACOA8Y_003757 [Serratia marcescens]|uniref:Uncharacterized protein n=1 Tax=Serratia marcescens TaxID=615 RepID=A0AAP8PWQ4_SERMA|nr:hypothetical protein [Serratia marcescens]POP17316.1 hypothetical protein C3R40_07535 [Serratia marcescens]
MSRRTRWGDLGIIVWVMLAAKEAQAVESALAGTYAKLALLSVSDDINAASFRSEEIRYTRYSLPWQFGALPLTDNLSWVSQMRVNWLDVRSVEAIDYSDYGQSLLTPRWSVSSLVGSGHFSQAISASLTLNYGGSIGLLKFENRSHLSGALSQEAYSQLKNSGIVGATSNILQVSPSTGVTYQYRRMNGDTLTLDGRLSWHALFPVGGERGSVKAGADTGTWSLRAEYRFAQVFKVAATPVDILLSEQPGGFWGKGYRDIDFGFISETALAAEAPVRVFGSAYRVRVGAGWLKNDKGTGMSIIVNLR